MFPEGRFQERVSGQRRRRLAVRTTVGAATSEKRWIQGRERRPDRLVIRRDPRDLSRIFVLDPRDGSYLAVPYRTLSRPTITLWEHRLALRRLRARRRSEVDEAALFAAIEEMRAIEREAAHLTRAMRRDRARRKQGSFPPPTGPAPDPGAADRGSAPAEVPHPFDDLEEW